MKKFRIIVEGEYDGDEIAQSEVETEEETLANWLEDYGIMPSIGVYEEDGDIRTTSLEITNTKLELIDD